MSFKERRTTPPYGNDKISIRSFLVLPKPAIEYSRVLLPMTNILKRSQLSQTPFILSRFLNILCKRHYLRHNITNIDKSIRYKDDLQTNAADTPNTAKFITSNNIQEFALDSNIKFKPPIQEPNENAYFEKFLNCIIPPNEVLLKNATTELEWKPLSFYSYLKEIEPMAMYSDNINYKIYNQIRKIIRENVTEYKTNIIQQTRNFSKYTQWDFRTAADKVMNEIQYIIKDNDQIYDYFIDYITDSSLLPSIAHLLKNNVIGNSNILPFAGSQLWQSMISLDYGNLYCKLLTVRMISLITPDKLFQVIDQPELDDMTKDEKLKSKDCVRRFLTKVYYSIKDLQDDNNKEDLFYEPEFDDTPYSIMDKYKDQKKTMPPETFIEFLKENLIQKHDCPLNMVNEMTETLMNRKKRIQNGEYAILKLVPSLTKGLNYDKMTKKEKDEVELEKKVKTLQVYYRRVKNNWVKDADIDPDTFIDSNALFCNISTQCHKNPVAQTCDSVKTARRFQLKNTANDVYKSFDDRFSMTVEEMKTHLQEEIERCIKRQKRTKLLNEYALYRANNVAYEIGKSANHEETIRSPYAALRDKIFGQTNFPKKQNDICMFFSHFCRDALPQGEDPHWAYCIETNIPLLPLSIYFLADEFVKGGDYAVKLAEICRFYGKQSDDGDAIVDKYSGYVLRKIDFVSENFVGEFTAGELETDLGTRIAEVFQAVATNQPAPSKQKKTIPKIYEDETTQYIYNIASVLMTNMDIQNDDILEFTMRLSSQKLKKVVVSENEYAIRVEKAAKKDLKTPMPPYPTYKHRTMIILVSSVLFVAIQTVTPALKPRKTFPNCVKSFRGFPLSGEEDTSGIKYVSCVIGKTKSSIVPWNSVEKVSVAALEKGMIEMMKKNILSDQEIEQLYQIKKENPEPIEDVPPEHSIQRWRAFMPPLVDITGVSISLSGLSKEYNEETTNLLSSGNKDQHSHIAMYDVKNRMNTYSIVEAIHSIVKTKDALLKTVAKIPFLENACCNERNTHPLRYFMTGDNETINKQIRLFLLRSQSNISFQRAIRVISKPFLFYNNEYSKWKCPDVPTGYIEQNMYAAFIYYCNLDNDRPISKWLKPILVEKPTGYMPSWTLEEKVDFLKRHGKRFGVLEMNLMMKIIHQQNLIQTTTRVVATGNTTPAQLAAGEDILDLHLENLERKDDSVLSEPFCRHLRKIIQLYKETPRQKINENDTSSTPFLDATRDLYDYLIRTNDTYFDTIIDYFKRYANTTGQEDLNTYEQFILTLTEWRNQSTKTDTTRMYDENLYNVIQFIKNAVFQMVQFFPNCILNKSAFLSGTSPSNIPTYQWNVKNKHKTDIETIIREDIAVLKKFQNQNILSLILEKIQEMSADIKIFVESMPIETETEGDAAADTPVPRQYHLFSQKTSTLIYTHLWFSVLYKHIEFSKDTSLQTINVEYNKSKKREQTRESVEDDYLLSVVQKQNDSGLEEEEDQYEYENDIDYEIRTNVCSLLMAYLTIQSTTKKMINKKYEDIVKNVTTEKRKEKKKITDRLENMEDEERKVEDMLKRYRLGDWNIGAQKGIYKYDKEEYEKRGDDRLAELFAEIDDEEYDVIDNSRGHKKAAASTLFKDADANEIEQFGRQNLAEEEGYNDLDMLEEDYYDNMGDDAEDVF
jgi:hypothetical protein